MSLHENVKGLVLIAGYGAGLFLLWLVALVLLAGLIFIGVTIGTDWDFSVRVSSSLIAAFVAMKVLGVVFGAIDLVPDSWTGRAKKTKPSPLRQGTTHG